MGDCVDHGIFWLASYPKSGNTWTRAFLANLLSESEEPVDINELNTGSIASSRQWVEEAIGYDISELSHEDVDALRPDAYRWIAAEEETGYHKIHDAYTYLTDGMPMIPREATQGAVYLVRNPLDVIPSYANHWSIEMDMAVDTICNSEHAFCETTRGQAKQLRQKLGMWSEHVESWLDADIPKLLVRYEDLRADPHHGFSAIAKFLKLERGAAEIADAVEKCRLDRLRNQEDEFGFRENPLNVKKFFRKGEVGGWKGILTEGQIHRVIETNRPAMERLGYVNACGKLVV